MGRRKKSFIDKRNSATFKLLARDTSTITYAAGGGGDVPSSDRVFVRVDNNPYLVRIFDEESYGECDGSGETPCCIKHRDDMDSIFADALDDSDDEGSSSQHWPCRATSDSQGRASHPLPEEARREILELGLPDDGYNYLQHLRVISNAGGGSSYYQNSKAKLELVPLDVKAYDASRLKITGGEGDELNKDSIYNVASKTLGITVHKVVDPDVARLLDDSDLSRFGSDVEELEEDFVLKANVCEGNGIEKVEEGTAASEAQYVTKGMHPARTGQEDESFEDGDYDEADVDDKPRIHRLLDEQFNLLTNREYNDDNYSDGEGHIDAEGDVVAEKLQDALKGCKVDDLKVDDQYYRVPRDDLHEQGAPIIWSHLDDSTDVICKCREYAEKYCNENEGEELIIVQESSDESEVWDCETIVSTYSNLDNHPGKIQAPDNPKSRFLKNIPIDTIKKSGMIELRGKQKLPVDFLPHGKKDIDKVKKSASLSFEKQKIGPRREESKEEKKERKLCFLVFPRSLRML
ncbi:hypothetical protein AXF42_Ash000637 [Apostasia shenzhenica]|uniref:Uncharacterized protein n=1 Tax=Apostasia shenzhenica TaxID=1088818 RepID=A0A2I0AGX8_9ASPA|nr:hypothetical protein AXF42_Ash000637 [Apostasia shenzhenica]